MNVKDAITIILIDQQSPALNYAVNYCAEAMRMPDDSHELKVQCLYILSNITRWRHPRAKEVRECLKKFSK